MYLLVGASPRPPLCLLAGDVKVAHNNIVLGGVAGVEEGSPPPPPPSEASPSGMTYASVTRSAGRISRRGVVRVVASAGCAKAARPPIQPTAAAMSSLLPSTMAVQPHRLY